MLPLLLLAGSLAHAQSLPAGAPWALRRGLQAAPAPSAPPPDCARHPARSPVACGCAASRAPPHFNLSFATTAGAFSLRVARADAPLGADRLHALSACGDYLGASLERGNENAFFRVVPGFVVQFGISGAPAVSQAWEGLVLANDAPNKLSNVRGTLAYAAEQDAAGRACNRTTQVYINYADNSRLDALGFTVIGVVDDMAAVDAIVAKWAQEPDQDEIYSQGNAYLARSFPGLSYINSTLVTAA
jgi:peptidyl-prolyl cis-trans isomerase A (cyclophilin A)